MIKGEEIYNFEYSFKCRKTVFLEKSWEKQGKSVK